MAPAADRQQYRALVAEIAEKAKAKLPQETNGRIEKVVALVLAGDVAVQTDGSIQVGSCVDPLSTHLLIGTSCSCDDFQYHRAPSGWCKHRIAAGIAKRAAELMPPAPEPIPAPTPQHHEAPASINLKLLLHGHEVMVTLRDRDEGVLLSRLQALLKRPDIRPIPGRPAARTGGWRKGH